MAAARAKGKKPVAVEPVKVGAKVIIDIGSLKLKPPNMGEMRILTQLSGMSMSQMQVIDLETSPPGVVFAAMYVAARRRYPRMTVAEFDRLEFADVEIVDGTANDPDAEEGPTAASAI